MLNIFGFLCVCVCIEKLENVDGQIEKKNHLQSHPSTQRGSRLMLWVLTAQFFYGCVWWAHVWGMHVCFNVKIGSYRIYILL